MLTCCTLHRFLYRIDPNCVPTRQISISTGILVAWGSRISPPAACERFCTLPHTDCTRVEMRPEQKVVQESARLETTCAMDHHRKSVASFLSRSCSPTLGQSLKLELLEAQPAYKDPVFLRRGSGRFAFVFVALYLFFDITRPCCQIRPHLPLDNDKKALAR